MESIATYLSLALSLFAALKAVDWARHKRTFRARREREIAALRNSQEARHFWLGRLAKNGFMSIFYWVAGFSLMGVALFLLSEEPDEQTAFWLLYSVSAFAIAGGMFYSNLVLAQYGVLGKALARHFDDGATGSESMPEQ